MIPVMQTEFGENGNCLRACVASLVESDLIDVPDFQRLHRDTGGWILAFFDFLRSRGFDCLGTATPGTPFYEHLIHGKDLPDTCEAFYPPEGFYIVGGDSPRSTPNGHGVIFGPGAVLAHDPHPDGTGIVGEPFEIYLIEKTNKFNLTDAGRAALAEQEKKA